MLLTEAMKSQTLGTLYFSALEIVKIESPNYSPEPSAVDAGSSVARSTSQVGVGSHHDR